MAAQPEEQPVDSAQLLGGLTDRLVHQSLGPLGALLLRGGRHIVEAEDDAQLVDN